MKSAIYLDKNNRKYKGNIHTHSTRSDGQYAPEVVIQAYKKKGYDFMCLSDHEIYWKSDAHDDDTFIMLDGYEMACETNFRKLGKYYHIHGLLDKSLGSEQEFEHDEEHTKPEYESLETIQNLIDEMRAKGNLVIMNHPEWSKNTPEELLALEGYYAIEIYNHQSDLDEASGSGVYHWDYVLRHGRRVFAVAADDAHRGELDTAICEFFGGWIQVEADQLKQQSIIDTMKEGRYYSSNGPEIYDLRVEDGWINITCSPVKYIKFITNPGFGYKQYNKKDAAPITEGRYLIKGNEQYVRIECIDFEGNIAWSNPIFPADLEG